MADVQALEADEIGAYILLLCYAWEHQGIPTDLRRIAGIGKIAPRHFERVWGTLAPYWEGSPICPTCYINPRLEAVREEAAIHVGKQSDKGRRGAERRWQKDSPSNAQAQREQCLHDDRTMALRSPISNYEVLRTSAVGWGVWPEGDELKALALIFVHRFANCADPEKAAKRHLFSYSTTLAAMRQRGVTIAQAWKACEDCWRAGGEVPLWGGKIKSALSFLPAWRQNGKPATKWETVTDAQLS